MIRQRIIAFLMIALEAAAAEYLLLQFEWFPVVLVVIAALGTPGFARVKLSNRAMLVTALILTVFISYATESDLLFAHRLPVLPYLTGYAYSIGWCVLVIQVALLFVRSEDGRLPVYFPALGAAVLAYAGQRHESNDLLYHGAALMFVILTVLYWSSTKARDPIPPPRSVRLRGALIQGSVLLVALPVAFVTSNTIGANRNTIDATFTRLVGAVVTVSKVGFSTEARLDSVKRLKVENGDKVALRVYADEAPGYMRGRAYDTYDKGRWTVTAKEKTLPRAPEDVAKGVANASGALFEAGSGKPPFASLIVAPAALFEGCLFAPLDSVYVCLQDVSVTGDSNGNLRISELPAASDYQVITGARTEETLSDDMRSRFTALPAEIDPDVRNLAARLFENCATVSEKSEAVVRYFADNYTYQLGVEVPPGNDPVTYFLLEQPPAHCEYFASGAVFLLRLGSVPCRYVTGFVTDERNAFGGYWVAHNKNAHAWVEVFDDDQKAWVTIEPTVAAGVPSSSDSNQRTGLLAQLRDFASYIVQSIRTAIVTGNWGKLLPILKALRWELAALGLVVSAIVVARSLRRRKKTPRVARTVSSPEEKELLRLRQHVDREMRRQGLVRKPDETIGVFAGRVLAAASSQTNPATSQKLGNAATWYGKYNEIRFRGPLSQDSLAELRRDSLS
ncbi:MAG: transglutaminase domain-containing protein [Candidatus Hydrogenedentes bacterium]|nr:transglutaminase domain-containing protein [Candidatus Hydrogenedentota bacterium]